MISYKTSNTQDVIDNMPFYIFNNFVIYLNEIIDEENKKSNGDSNGQDSPNDMMKSASNMMNSQMSTANSMFSKSNMKLK